MTFSSDFSGAVVGSSAIVFHQVLDAYRPINFER